MARILKVAFVVSVLIIWTSCSSKPDYSPNPAYRRTRFPQTRTDSEAKLWLHWNAAERLAFVRAFVIGYRKGKDEGCAATEMAAQLSVSESTCRKQTCACHQVLKCCFWTAK